MQLALLALLALAQSVAGGASDSSSAPSPFVSVDGSPEWWPPVEFTDATGELLPNPGPSLFAYQFNGPTFGRNYVSLPHSLSAALPRSMTVSAWIYLPSEEDREMSRKRCATCSNVNPPESGGDDDDSSSGRNVIPLVSRFNPRMTTGPDNLESYQDFQLAIDAVTGKLIFWMGGQYSVEYGVNFESPSAVPTGEWVNVAVSVVSSDNRNPFFAALFINGARVAEQNWAVGATRVFQTNEVVQLGYYSRGSNEYYFEGLMDEVIFWGAAKRATELTRDLNLLRDGTEEDLVALYRFDDLGAMIADATPAAHHGYSLKPLWTLSWAPMLHWREVGVQGFPIDIHLSAVDLIPTAQEGFEFTVTKLPQNGGVFLPDSCEEDPCYLTEVDLGFKVFGSLIHYVCDPDFLGADSFCFAARRVNETEWSDSATIDIECLEAPPTGCLEMIDECGVCGGDGTSCKEGGCDGFGAVEDPCGVCGGDGSSCSCTVYKTYRLSELDCILFDHAINRTLLVLERTINTLVDTLDGMAYYEVTDSGALSLLSNVNHLCAIDQCLADYEEEVEVFDEYITSYLDSHVLCEQDDLPLLEDSDRVLNDHTRYWVRQ